MRRKVPGKKQFSVEVGKKIMRSLEPAKKENSTKKLRGKKLGKRDKERERGELEILCIFNNNI